MLQIHTNPPAVEAPVFRQLTLWSRVLFQKLIVHPWHIGLCWARRTQSKSILVIMIHHNTFSIYPFASFLSFHYQNPECIFFFPPHYVLLDLITPLTFGEEQKSSNFWPVNFLLPPATSSLLPRYLTTLSTTQSSRNCGTYSNLNKNVALVKLVTSKLKVTHRHSVSNSRLTNSICAKFTGNS